MQPEAHDILHSFTGRHYRGVIDGKLPRLFRFQKSIIQSRLTFEEIQDICSAAFAFPSHIGESVRSFETEIRPDIAVGILVPCSFLALAKPIVFLRCMTGYQIQQNTDFFFMCFLKQCIQILIGSIAGSHFFIVTHIITGILEWRVKTGIDPKRIASEASDVIQFFNNPFDITDSIPV